MILSGINGPRLRPQESFVCCDTDPGTASCHLVKAQFLVLALLFNAGLPLSGRAEKEEPAQALVTAALASFENKDFDTAQTKLEEANKLQPGSPFILNLLGAIQTKKKKYAAAKGYFEKALESSPGFFPAHFNLGELLFLQKQYPQALSRFSQMLKQNPDNELLQFKVILSLLLTDQPEDARKLLARMTYPIKSPAKFYAEAALEIVAGHNKAATQLTNKGRILFPEKAILYDETFQDLDWPLR